MVASFYNNKTVMVGFDRHPVRIIGTTTVEKALGKEKPEHLYLAVVRFDWPGGDDGKRTSTVTADGEKMIREGFTIGKVPHVPGPALFHPTQLITNAKVIKDSKTSPFLTTARVTSEGDPLAICFAGHAGFDMNCREVAGEKPEGMTGLAISFCTVTTQPSLKDVVFGVFDAFIKEWLADRAVELLDLVLRYFKIGAVPRAVVQWIAEKVVPALVDWEEAAKVLWDVMDRAINTPQRSSVPTAALLTV